MTVAIRPAVIELGQLTFKGISTVDVATLRQLMSKNRQDENNINYYLRPEVVNSQNGASKLAALKTLFVSLYPDVRGTPGQMRKEVTSNLTGIRASHAPMDRWFEIVDQKRQELSELVCQYVGNDDCGTILCLGGLINAVLPPPKRTSTELFLFTQVGRNRCDGWGVTSGLTKIRAHILLLSPESLVR